MRRLKAVLAGLSGLAAASCASGGAGEAVEGTAYDFAFSSIVGEEMPLSAYDGQVLLVVNTASRCGFTPQYEGLQTLWETYRGQGLVVVGVPSNDFRQELADEAAVAEFCNANYDIDFPMTAINHVRGEDTHPFYAWTAAVMGGDGTPSWNFHKILIGRDGRPVDGFGPQAAPMSARVVEAVEAALAAG